MKRVRVGAYENVSPFCGREGFYTATRSFPAEPAVHAFLLQAVPRADAEASMRLTLLARVLAKLEWNCLPRIADLGMTDDSWYLVLHVTGPLELLSSPRSDGLQIVRQLASALVYLHGQGFAHRGLMPAAIAVGGSGEPLLYDLSWMGRLTEGSIVKTVLDRRKATRYDAPEASGKEFDGVRADIFSLGVLAHELTLPPRHADLLERMRHPTPGERPASMKEVFEGLH